jgi:predicted exporter
LRGRATALALWFVALAVCGWIVAQARFTSDMSAFLPELPSRLQRLLAEQLREGVAARLILVGIHGAPPDQLAQTSRALAQRLAGAPEFLYVANGDTALARHERDFLFVHRYVLSPAVVPGRFDPPALAAALERAYEALSSPAGVLLRRYVPADPTGEGLQLLRLLEGGARPAMHGGVWVSRDQTYALALVHTRAAGFDLDAQEHNIAVTERAFAEARAESGANTASLTLTGPPVFGVNSRAAIKSDARFLSGIASVAIAALLLAVYRSPRLVLFAFLPVATGALAGVAAVAVWFGTVHVITLGFGVTLIGEAVDYAIYFFSHRLREEAPRESLARIWPTLRLGMLTSAASFCAMLASGFPGLAQLGLFSVAGLAAALATTRWILPRLVPGDVTPAFVEAVARLVPAWRKSDAARFVVLALVLVASGVTIALRQPMWDDDLARLNPISTADQALDQRLRSELAAPDARLLAVVSAPTEEDVLQRAEALHRELDKLVAAGLAAGYDSPATYLPSRATQAARRKALPDEATLRANLAKAVAASPFKPDLFKPFLADVAAARVAPPLTRESLRGTAFGLKVDALLVERPDAWHALLPLRGVIDPAAAAERITGLGLEGVETLDIKTESTRLMRTYREQALGLFAIGSVLIAILLAAHLRSAARVVRVLAPIIAAVAATAACLLAAGVKLTLFHLVALLLVVGVGSNYALFFDRVPRDESERRRTVFSLALCALTAGLAFGLLALSDTPVLIMIGSTVAVGVAVSLACAALVARRAEPFLPAR